MARFQDRFIHATSWETNITSYIKKMLDKCFENVRNMRMIQANTNENQVYEGQARLCIDLEKGYYSCGEMIMIEIQGRHVMPYVHHKRVELKDACCTYYTKVVKIAS